MAVWIAFTRHSGPNLASLSGAIFIFFIVIYLRGFRTYVTLIYQPSRGYSYKFPIKLFYTSTISIILQSIFISHFYQISLLLFNRFPKFFLVRLLGTWEGDSIVSGLVWWISPPRDLGDWAAHPIRAVVYTTFVAVSSAAFARYTKTIT
jgi:protein transport protein SEC61 subunit alpha